MWAVDARLGRIGRTGRRGHRCGQAQVRACARPHGALPLAGTARQQVDLFARFTAGARPP